MKNKELYQGIIASFFASSSAIIFILLFFSGGQIEDAISSLFQQKKLAGLISIGSLINLPLFFLGMYKRKTKFAKGVMITSIIIVLMVAMLKII